MGLSGARVVSSPAFPDEVSSLDRSEGGLGETLEDPLVFFSSEKEDRHSCSSLAGNVVGREVFFHPGCC